MLAILITKSGTSPFSFASINEKTVFSLGESNVHRYYTTECLISFVKDIIYVSQLIAKDLGVDITLLLKHKREHLVKHDEKYIGFIANCEFEKSIKIVDHDINLFNLVDFSDLSIAIPYSSTAYVSCFREKTSIFYDPTGDIISDFIKNKYVLFSSEKKELYNQIITVIKDKTNG